MPFPAQLGQRVVPLHAVSGTTVSQTVLGHDQLTFISAISLWKQYNRPSGVVVRVTLTVLSSSAAGNGVRGAERAEWALPSCRAKVECCPLLDQVVYVHGDEYSTTTFVNCNKGQGNEYPQIALFGQSTNIDPFYCQNSNSVQSKRNN